MKSSYLNTLIVIVSMFIFTGSVLLVDPPERIFIDPNEVDKFVIDPADFDPDDGETAILRHEPFGRKDEAVYTRGTKEDGTPIIIAESNNAISTVTTQIDADPHEFQYLEWEWKIESVLESGDLTKKDGDDFTARVYVTFDFDSSDLGFRERVRYTAYRAFTSFDIPLRSLNYIWSNKAEVGTVAPSPFTDWVKYVAIQSGNEHAGEWRTEKRNIVEDFREAFGEEPNNITGITIMTDSDNTEESTRAYFGKITLSKE